MADLIIKKIKETEDEKREDVKTRGEAARSSSQLLHCRDRTEGYPHFFDRPQACPWLLPEVGGTGYLAFNVLLN